MNRPFAPKKLDGEYMTQKQFCEMLGINRKTAYRMRTEGRVVGTELVMLYSINTSGKRGKVLIPLTHEHRFKGVRYLGAAEFVGALACDPVLEYFEVEL